MKLDNILTKEYLEQEYIFRKKTLRQIAFKNNCSVYPVRMRLIRYNIPRRQERNNPMFGKKHTLDARKKMSVKQRNKKMPLHAKILISKIMKKFWNNTDYRQKQLCAIRDNYKSCCNHKINKIELKMLQLLKILFKKDYKYVGDGQVILEGFNPDFININGQKKIVELYGDYWHNLSDCKSRDRKRLKTYTKLGYKTLIIWEHELKDLDYVAGKLTAFHEE